MSTPAPTGLRPITKWALLLLALSPFALAVPELLTEENSAEPLPPMAPRQSGTRLTIADIRPVTGFALNAHHIGDLDLYLASVDRVADLGANALIVFTPMFQHKVNSTEIRFLPEKCATDEQLVAILERARERGLHTTLVPVVLIEKPAAKEWRGLISPSDWDAWWSSYVALIDRFVAVANLADVDLLAVGSELNSTEDQLDRWEAVIASVRERFGGQITYSANWDRYDKMKLWPLVDVISVSSYFELEPEESAASEGELARAWAAERGKLRSFARNAGLPLLLSEVGYPSLPWAHQHPWNYVANEGDVSDPDAQALCWRAFFRAWTNEFCDPEGPVAGFFGYHWDPYRHGDENDMGYGIDGKPALDVVRKGIAKIRRAVASPS
jgi:hypothetical protein